MFLFLYTYTLLSLFANPNQKTYVKNYFDNGKIKSQGWVKNDLKTDYWFYYNDNGNIKEEGHYYQNKKTKWWIFYDMNQEIIKKCQYQNDKMDGFCIIYYKGNIIRGEKFKNGEKIKQWQTVEAFKKDNPISYLY